MKANPTPLPRPPNQDILKHEQLRKIEVELYKKELDPSIEEGEPIPFFPKDEYETIIDLVGDTLNLHL